ncbi:uncharacterized, partial [Tachysurus ichikawai]
LPGCPDPAASPCVSAGPAANAPQPESSPASIFILFDLFFFIFSTQRGAAG